MTVNEITGHIVDGAMKVHTAMGPGLLESAYALCLTHELRQRGLKVERQVAVDVFYYGTKIETGFRIDMLVEDSVVVELKAVSNTLPVHEAQLLSYLKLTGYRAGLLVNFHVRHLKDGIKRMVNEL